MQAAASPPKYDFLPQFEALRGIAAFVVATYHMGVVGPLTLELANPQAVYDRGGIEGFLLHAFFWLMNGFGAVVIFFALSGFVLARSLDRPGRTTGGQATLKFFIGRIFRLYPAGIATVAIFTAVYFLFGFQAFPAPYDATNIVLNALIVHFDITIVMWSLKVELVATPLILLCVVLARRYGAWPLLLILTILIVVSFARSYYTVLGPGSNLAPLHAFVFGILAHFYGAAAVARVPRARIPWLLAVAVVALCAARPSLGLTPRTILIESVCAATMVTIVAFCPWVSFFHWLDGPLVRWLGRISYSFYLLHPLAMAVFLQFGTVYRWAYAHGVPLIVIVVAASLISVVITLPAAHLMWKWVELPGIAVGRRVSRYSGFRQAANVPG